MADQLEAYAKDLEVVARLQAEYNTQFPASLAYIYIVVTMVLCIAKPRLGFVLLVGSIIIRFQDRVGALQAFPIFLILTLCLILGMAANKAVLTKPDPGIDKAVLYFFCFVAFGLLIQAPGDLIRNIYMLWSSAMFYFFATRLVSAEEDLRRLTIFIAICCTALCLEAVVATWSTPDTSVFFAGGGDPRDCRAWDITAMRMSLA